MKVFTSAQIRDWDAYTIAHEPVESLALMERAAAALRDWLVENADAASPLDVFCGMGNNGGDGLALTRLLLEAGREARAWIVAAGKRFTTDAEVNHRRLETRFPGAVSVIGDLGDMPPLEAGYWVIDAVFGTGLSRPVTGLAAAVIERINQAGVPVISVDMPSGMRADDSSRGGPVVRATHTLSFQCMKKAFLMAENARATGRVHLLDIGLDPAFEQATITPDYLTGAADVRRIYRPREAFSHKGTYGHALVIAGSYGKMGAAVLSTRACLRAGAGLVTALVPSSGYGIMQTAVPEAMCETSAGDRHLTGTAVSPGGYRAVGVGPGLGTHPETAAAVAGLLSMAQAPMVLDADALNIVSQDKRLIGEIPPGSILTPHPKEFERLFGEAADEFRRMELQRSLSVRHDLYIVLKGHRSCISTPDGRCYFNPTGNAGMATGGSGDVLTGILTALLAQGYDPGDAAVLGVYLHGLAGDAAAAVLGQEALIASDLAEYLGQAFKML
jgi:NAD(P)H-hydrate epimerase